MSAAGFAPQARRDVIAAVRWIAQDNPAAARAFRDAVSRAARRLGDHPDQGVVKAELVELPVRFLALAGFVYVIVYDAERHPPLILRVLHGARDLPQLLGDL